MQSRQRRTTVHIQLRQLIVVAVQLCQRRTTVHIQRLQLIAVAVQFHQRRTIVHIQRLQLILGAVQHRQLRVLAQIQRRQLILGAVQLRQCRIFAQIQRLQRIVVAVQRRQRGIFAQIQRRQLIHGADQRRQRLEILDSLQGGHGLGVNIEFGDLGNFCHIFPRDMLGIGDYLLLLQYFGELRVEQSGEIRIVGYRRLGDGQLHALLFAGDFHISRAGLHSGMYAGGQFDCLLAGRAVCGLGGQPVGVGFVLVILDREGPVGRSGERDRCRPPLDGVERVVGLFDYESGLRGGRIGCLVVLAASGKGERGSKCQQIQQIETFHERL